MTGSFKGWLMAATITAAAAGALAQVTPAGGYTPPDDTPSFKVGATIFADYTKGDRINDAFNISRAYINVTGNLNHYLSYRVTPDVTRESGSGSSLNGSLTFRLKYAYGELKLDDWTTKGSWVRFGVVQTPYLDYTESIYRYRWQGTLFPEREGYITSADAGIAGHWNFPGGYGDVQAGFYNGEGYSRAEVNDEKGFQIRGSLRPFPLGGIWKGLRVTGFAVEDNYQENAKRERLIGQVTFEHTRGNAGLELLKTKDQATPNAITTEGSGFAVWATPKLFNPSWELLLRHDETKPAKGTDQKRKRDIVGIAYWVPNLQKVTAALMLDYDSLRQSGYTPVRPRDTRYGLKMFINF
jgi:hypothetical protein